MTPLLILLAIHYFPILDKFGSIFLSYAVGCVVGVAGLLPSGSSDVLTGVANAAIPVAIPLMLLSSDIKSWRHLAPAFVKSTLCALLGGAMAIALAFGVFADGSKDVFAQAGGMLAGLYSGGNANLASVMYALNVDDSVFLQISAYSIAASAIYIVFIIAVSKYIVHLVLPAFKGERSGGADGSYEGHDKELFYGLFRKDNISHLAAALGVALLIVAVGFGLTQLVSLLESVGVPVNFQAVFILSISVLSILASLNSRIRGIHRSFEAGSYLILVFGLAIASRVNSGMADNINYNLLWFTFLATFCTFAFHVLLSFVLRIDGDTTLATSISLICSPPFVPVVAGVVKNKAIVGPGIAVGLIGYAIGTYYGLLVSMLLFEFC